MPSGSTVQPASLHRALRTSLLSQCFGSLKLPYIRSPEKIFAAMALLLLSLLLLFSLSFHVGSLVPEVILSHKTQFQSLWKPKGYPRNSVKNRTLKQIRVEKGLKTSGSTRNWKGQKRKKSSEARTRAWC